MPHYLLYMVTFALQVQPLGNSRTIIDIEGTAYVAPKRSWLVPLSLLLPVSIGIRATIRLGVRGPLDTGRVSEANSRSFATADLRIRWREGHFCVVYSMDGGSIGIRGTTRLGVRGPLDTGRVSGTLLLLLCSQSRGISMCLTEQLCKGAAGHW